MKIGIVGLPMVGKTTLFNLLTGSTTETSRFMSGKTDANVGVARVPDARIDYLSRLYKPRKTTYAQIEFTDVPGLVRGASSGQGVGNQFLAAIRDVDALVEVVRVFASPDVTHVEGNIDPMRDIQTVGMELLFADLELVEKRLERIASAKNKKKTPEQEAELVLLEKLREGLEAEKSVFNLDLAEEERVVLRQYGFFTQKPLLLVPNLDDKQLRAGDYPGKGDVEAWAAANGVPLVEVCGALEEEIGRLGPEDREIFLADLGLSEPGVDRLSRAVYARLGLISFLTSGEDEVKAWTIDAGMTAKQAAGKIHTDIERGFIRAEVVAFADFQAVAGSMAKARDAGKVRLEGKDYVVKDGDIVHFRFNV